MKKHLWFHVRPSAALLMVLTLVACGTKDGASGDDDIGQAGSGDTQGLTDATDGSDGTDGTTGADGADGADATDGTGATDGTDGTDSADSADGIDASDGVVTCEPKCESPEICLDGTCQVPKICVPGEWLCNGITSKKQCNAAGTGFEAAIDCPGEQYCTSGQCGTSCITDPKFGAFVGCAFWTVDTPTWKDPTMPNSDTLPHAVVVSNPGELTAKLEFTPPPGVTFNFPDLEVPGNSSMVYQFPALAVNGSDIANVGIRLESNRPVLVHQFNPWDNTYSNDASLLLPEPILGQEHVVLSWPTDTRCLISIPGLPNIGGPCAHGFVTVVATQDDTEVFVRVTSPVAATELPPGVNPATYTAPVKKMAKGAVQTFVLKKGQVLNLDAMPESAFEQADLTGTLVLTNKPAAVFSGHDSAAISNPAIQSDPDQNTSCCLDHLEEQILPVDLLGQSYIAAKTKSRGGESDLWRIVAAQDGVTIKTTPSISGLDGKTLAKQGDWVEAYTPQSFDIAATGKVLVGQYLVAQGNTNSGTGDPSLILAIPTERFRTNYPLMVPPKYDGNYVTVVRQSTTTITLDGIAVSAGEFSAIGSGSWEVAYLEIGVGVHTIAGDAPFGLYAYGYNSAVSYGYPGGLAIPGEANP